MNNNSKPTITVNMKMNVTVTRNVMRLATSHIMLNNHYTKEGVRVNKANDTVVMTSAINTYRVTT